MSAGSGNPLVAGVKGKMYLVTVTTANMFSRNIKSFTQEQGAYRPSINEVGILLTRSENLPGEIGRSDKDLLAQHT